MTPWDQSKGRAGTQGSAPIPCSEPQGLQGAQLLCIQHTAREGRVWGTQALSTSVRCKTRLTPHPGAGDYEGLWPKPLHYAPVSREHPLVRWQPRGPHWPLARSPCAPGFASHHPGVPFSKSLSRREAETESTHLDLIPVVPVLLQHSGRVERSQRHHCGLLEEATSPDYELQPWGTACPPHPPPFSQSRVGRQRLREAREAVRLQVGGHNHTSVAGARASVPSPSCLAALPAAG